MLLVFLIGKFPKFKYVLFPLIFVFYGYAAIQTFDRNNEEAKPRLNKKSYKNSDEVIREVIGKEAEFEIKGHIFRFPNTYLSRKSVPFAPGTLVRDIGGEAQYFELDFSLHDYSPYKHNYVDAKLPITNLVRVFISIRVDPGIAFDETIPFQFDLNSLYVVEKDWLRYNSNEYSYEPSRFHISGLGSDDPSKMTCHLMSEDYKSLCTIKFNLNNDVAVEISTHLENEMKMPLIVDNIRKVLGEFNKGFQE